MRAQPGTTFDLSSPRRVHVIGVGGPGMSALAVMLAQMGHRVSGSDLRASPGIARLQAEGVAVNIGHDPAVVDGVDVVCVSTAIPEGNVEWVAARRAGIPVLHRSALLAAVVGAAPRPIGVAGTHGKTTTTSMLVLMAVAGGLDPSFYVGGDVHDVGTNARWTGADVVLVEGDESDGTLQELPLHGLLLTNVDVDHLDHYGTVEAIHDSFDAVTARVRGPRVLCADDPFVAELARRHGGVTYGRSPGAHWRLDDVEQHPGSVTFTVHHPDGTLPVTLPMRGRHMALNATGALAMAAALGVEPAVAADALARFGGVARRFEFRGEDRGITFVDDYAHLPAELAASIEAAATSGDGWRRVVAVFQPNRFSRMAALSRAYADCFVHADLVVLTEIYGSGEAPLPGVTGKLVVDAVLDAHPWAQVAWLPRRADLVAYLASTLRPGDLCLSMGCGDIATLPDEVLAELARRRSGG